MKKSRELKFCIISFFLIVALTALRLYSNYYSILELQADEAQYWGWSKDLAWGYYSKPPLVALFIKISTYFLGDTVFAIRLFSPILHGFTAIVIFLIAKKLGGIKAAMWSSLLYITLPGVYYSSMFMSTDPILLFFWSLSIFFFIKALDHDERKYWVLAGLCAGLGMQGKYTMVFFLPSVLLYFWAHGELKKQLTNRSFYAAIAVCALIFMPNLVWNFAHQFVTINHTKDISKIQQSLVNPMNGLKFFLYQFLIFGPILFGSLLIIILKARTLARGEAFKLLLCFIVPVLGVIQLLSFVSDAYTNWAAIAYVTASILVATWLVNIHKEYLIKLSLVINVVFGIILYNFFDIAIFVAKASKNDKVKIAVSRSYARFSGWSLLGEEISEVAEKYPTYLLLFDERKLLAEMQFYVKPHPFDKIRKFKAGKEIRDHYDLTVPLTGEDKGKSFIYVTRLDDLSVFRPSFSSVERIKTLNHGNVKYNIYKLRKLKR